MPKTIIEHYDNDEKRWYSWLVHVVANDDAAEITGMARKMSGQIHVNTYDDDEHIMYCPQCGRWVPEESIFGESFCPVCNTLYDPEELEWSE